MWERPTDKAATNKAEKKLQETSLQKVGDALAPRQPEAHGLEERQRLHDTGISQSDKQKNDAWWLVLANDHALHLLQGANRQRHRKW